MKKSKVIVALLSAFVAGSAVAGLPNYDKGNNLLQGDQRLACEAILCLSQGFTSGECRNSIKRYYSIKARKAWKTAQLRRNFLNLCPKDDGKVNKDKLSKIGLDFSKD